MSFSDIMNIMKVSSSKFTFSLIAFAALLVSGSGLMIQDADAVILAPEFTCKHLNTTATHCTFNQAVNGTLAILDWSLKASSTAVAGDTATDITITHIQNATSTGLTDATHRPAGTGATSDVAATTTGTGITAVAGLGYINGTDFVLIHSAIVSDTTYFINYTNNPATNADAIAQPGQIHANEEGGVGAGNAAGAVGACFVETQGCKYLKIGSNATAVDWMVPTAVSAEVLKSNPKQVRITMSETIANVNSTFAEFTMTTFGGGNAAVPATFSANNGTIYLYVNLQNPVTAGDVLTIAYNSDTDGDAHGADRWITDGIDSTQYTTSGGVQSAEWYLSGHGNRLANFTAISITNWIPVGFDGSSGCYDCSAPIVTDVQVSLDGSTPVTVTNDNVVQINAGNGDTVSIMVTVADNTGADTLTFAGLYTNFGDTPDNLFYANNFDSFKQMSTSYYEWNARSDNTVFGNTDAITWDEATATINPDGTQTITYTMTINDSIESSQVWVDLGDLYSNYAKSALPITLEVAGPPAITFASDDSQKVVSYFNESILMAIVSQWTATSSDDATNVEQLSSILGIEDQLPTWTTSLASWVSDDKIDVADMIVAVEYVINQ
jgi:hypothetical protein